MPRSNIRSLVVSAAVVALLASHGVAFAQQRQSQARPRTAPAQQSGQPASGVKAVPMSATGDEGYGTAGCGLGSMVFAKQKGIVQIFAGTTNNIIVPQSFAISTGTSNCDAGSQSRRTASVETFVAANRTAFERDVTRGSGDTIAAVGELVGCPNTAGLGQELQGQFGYLFPAQSSSDRDVSARVLEIVNQPAGACRQAG